MILLLPSHTHTHTHSPLTCVCSIGVGVRIAFYVILFFSLCQMYCWTHTSTCRRTKSHSTKHVKRREYITIESINQLFFCWMCFILHILYHLVIHIISRWVHNDGILYMVQLLKDVERSLH